MRSVRVDQVFNGGSAAVTTSRRTYATEAPDDGPLHISDVTVDLPCQWLRALATLGGSCSVSTRRTETIVHMTGDDDATRVGVFSRQADVGDQSGPYVFDDNLSVSSNSYSYEAVIDPAHGADVVVPMPPMRNRIKIQLDDIHNPTIQNGDPRPIVVLASPPYVNGAGQVPLAGPTYNARTTTGGSVGTSTSNTISMSFGVELPDPTGLLGFSATASFEASAFSGSTSSTTITTSEQFVGSPVEDVIVYSASTFWHYPGKIIESSTGVGLDSVATVNIPRSDVITSATFPDLQRRYPDLFADGTSGKGIMGRILTHEPGDPGSYTEWGAPIDPSSEIPNSRNVKDYCDGASFDGTGETVDERGGYPFGVFQNPFATNNFPPPNYKGPGILPSDRHQVQIGSNNSEGAGFSISHDTDHTRGSEMTMGAEVAYNLGVFTGTAGVAQTWGTEVTSTFGTGVDFLGYVGHIPYPELTNETYDWRIFLCKKSMGDDPDLPGFGGAVWVLDYTVDGYAENATHGLDAVSRPPARRAGAVGVLRHPEHHR